MGYATSGELRKEMMGEDDGTFRLVSQTTYQLVDGLSGRETEELWGTLQGGSALAAWHAHVDVVDRGSGAEIDDCDIRFGVRATSAKGRVFGGLTSQGAPIVVQLSDDARSVSAFSIGWKAECAQLGFVPLGSTLRNLPMTRGRFGGGVSETRRTPGPETSARVTRSQSGSTSSTVAPVRRGGRAVRSSCRRMRGGAWETSGSAGGGSHCSLRARAGRCASGSGCRPRRRRARTA